MLPEGYETVVGEHGGRLSGGQRQRIGTAQALYHDPEVPIRDEAESAADGITEDAVMDALNNLRHSKTLIMIAHRLTSVRDADVIYLLDRGPVIEQGTYIELIHSSPSFRAMAKGDEETAEIRVRCRPFETRNRNSRHEPWRVVNAER
jgi:ABC-type multidrug transport system fused ATPase/permease subunit